MSGFTEVVRDRFDRDSGLAREIFAAQAIQLDSATILFPWLRQAIVPGQELFAPDTLATVLRPLIDSTPLWGTPRDSILTAPAILERNGLAAMAMRDSLLLDSLRPVRWELWLAAVLALPQHPTNPFRRLPPKSHCMSVLAAMEIHESFHPGPISRYRTRRKSAGLQRFSQQLQALLALRRLAISLGTPESQWPMVLDVARLSLRSALEFSSPMDPDWHPLVTERARYLRLPEESAPAGTPKDILTDSVKKATLSQRLQRLGYGDDSTPMQARLESFQANHGRKPNGKLDDTTLLEIYFPDSLRAQAILKALDTLRGSSWHRENFYVKVNVPEFVLEAMENGKVLRKHRVVVGKDTVGRFTPVLDSRLERVVLNPEWHIPAKILREEIVAGKPFNEATLRAAGYEPKYDKEHKITGAFQPAGDENALGLVKILFPNPFGVYIHDTPSRHLFARRFRAFSHGCVRLENPMFFARFLLERDHHRLLEKLDSLQETGEQKWLKLGTTVPVHFEYRTVVPDSLGRVCFLRDIYALARERARLMRLAERDRLKSAARP
jgi:L,D-transpeptidase catalytic domain